MKPLFIPFILILLFKQVTAQEIITQNHPISMKEDMNVKIELEGEIFIENRDLPRAEIQIETIITGKVRGYDGNEKTRKNYDVIIEESGDTITITEKPSKSSFMIGISTIKVGHKHDIYLPESARISICTNDAMIHVNGNFRSIDIDNKNGACTLKLNQERIRFLGCFANTGKIVVNGINKNKRFILEGDGTATYSITTDAGMIKIFFMNADGIKSIKNEKAEKLKSGFLH